MPTLSLYDRRGKRADVSLTTCIDPLNSPSVAPYLYYTLSFRRNINFCLHFLPFKTTVIIRFCLIKY